MKRNENENLPKDEVQKIRINGIITNSDIQKVKTWLEMYGELLTEIRKLI